MKSIRQITSDFSNSIAPKSRRRRQGQNAQPTEALEDRVLLSNVTADFSRGDLVLTGDSDDNTISVKFLSGGIWIEGHEGTTVNGQELVNVPYAVVPDDLRANFTAGGDNTVLVQSMDVRDDVQYRGGDGVDNFAIMDSFVSGDVNIRTGDKGDVAVVADNMVSGKVVVETGNGGDKVLIGGEKTHGQISVNTGRGRDDVLMGDLVDTSSISIRTGSGNDAAFLSEITAEKLDLGMGRGRDEAMMLDVEVSEAFTAKGGSDIDAFEAVDVVYPARTQISQFEGYSVQDAPFRALALAVEIDRIFSAL